ncbi:TPA: fimbrial-like protein [Enterobacter cloacae]|uniref:fimbrial-like protein n=1 Tax=Enterobacter cloacae TaxID=550 RepID=UPI000BA89EFA|nr:fimbrial-like protein [Enterobacter cloacae]PAO18196.1 fimbrial protein [Enterobacter cloacae]HAS1030260.1 fimbrial-like protein [Enterobacter cloacae]HAS1045249.1 fimbrial-like protein [Enterobacter cloacae]HAS1053840.1 fimbrial-like protein [Enterobacter cloacae]HAS1076284.1 fimbrial-like protein [Enterobacter cloacae]
MFNKTLLAVATTALLSGLTFTASADDNQGSGKITFTGEVISAPCSITPGDENQTIELGEVADSVLNSGKNSLPVDVTIHLQDCILSSAGTTTDKVEVTFTSASTDATDTSLMKNTLDGNIGGATGVGVRLLDSGSNNVKLGEAIPVSFTTSNAYQELNFKARMEPLTGKTATPGNVQAQANYVLAYK